MTAFPFVPVLSSIAKVIHIASVSACTHFSLAVSTIEYIVKCSFIIFPSYRSICCFLLCCFQPDLCFFKQFSANNWLMDIWRNNPLALVQYVTPFFTSLKSGFIFSLNQIAIIIISVQHCTYRRISPLMKILSVLTVHMMILIIV